MTIVVSNNVTNVQVSDSAAARADRLLAEAAAATATGVVPSTTGIIRATSIAALRTNTPVANQIAIVSGYYTNGDGGGGEFYGVTGGSYTDDGSMTIVPGGGTGTTAWKRIVQGEINLKWFGAQPSLDNNATYIQAAFDYLVSSGGGALYVPSGRYRTRAQITVTSDAQQSITVIGDGEYQSIIDFSNNTTLGIRFVSTGASDNLLPKYEIKSLGLITSADNVGTALSFDYTNPNNLQCTVLISDVMIGQNIDRISDGGSGYGYWNKGVYFNNCRNAEIRNLFAFGEMNRSPNSSIGIHMEGECTAFVMSGMLIQEWTTGILADGTSEGIYVTNTDVIYCIYGLKHNSSIGSQPQLTVNACSFNTSSVGVWTVNIQQSVISDSLFYAASPFYTSSWPEWTGVLIEGSGSRYIKVANCAFSKENQRTGDTTTGIDLNGGYYYQLIGNTFFAFQSNPLSYGIQVRSGVGHVSISETNQYENVTAKVANSGLWVNKQPQVQSGQTSAVTTGSTVTFPQQFENTPIVTITHSGTSTSVCVAAASITTTGFTIYHNVGSAAVFNWIAAG